MTFTGIYRCKKCYKRQDPGIKGNEHGSLTRAPDAPPLDSGGADELTCSVHFMVLHTQQTFLASFTLNSTLLLPVCPFVCDSATFITSSQFHVRFSRYMWSSLRSPVTLDGRAVPKTTSFLNLLSFTIPKLCLLPHTCSN